MNVCAIGAASGLCTGCGRTLKEIAAWTAMTNAERDAIMAALPARLEAARCAAPAAGPAAEPGGR